LRLRIKEKREKRLRLRVKEKCKEGCWRRIKRIRLRIINFNKIRLLI